MSITFEIVKFKKPTKDDLSNLHMFNPYGSIPIIENYEYVLVNNSMLAKAEIPFLIFERNRGKCFIEMY